MEFNDVIKNRYACKKYDGTPVAKEALDAILAAGRLAPTAKNLQEHHVYVIQSEEGLKKVDELTPCRYGAPVVLMVTYDKTNVFTYPGGVATSGIEDATIVATHLCLAATANGVENCWLNYFDPAKAKALFGLPENEEVVLLMDLGHAADVPAGQPLANHASRKPLTETVTYL
ncbi:nitroreductase family protein [Selenomonas sp.]|uniref:nitroreductase family protein n=1 Tax=Selenomonas sp. TaxID=2053611 RepID=UPI0025CF2A06|nr:nitroreductase family protein [Selenomonas sp.]MCI6086116.1 nitroreductase family protein [Selenomonas sp.]MDY3296924.1 nitroreductase family protein [Selenomonas sp.]MDY4415244.1 nitroreductase family protein [Selenomonas sp.]